jgi:hypothetical protein
MLAGLPHPNIFSWSAHPFAAPKYFLCASHHHAAIYPLGWCIPLPHRNIFFRPAHPFAAPPSIHSAGASHRNSTIFLYSFGRRIPLPRCHLSICLVHPIAMTQYFHLAGTSLHCAAIYSSGLSISASHRNAAMYSFGGYGLLPCGPL